MNGLMTRWALALGLATAAFLAPMTAEAGCKCGRSYISDKKKCHKCPCECSTCTATCGADVPTFMKVIVPGSDALWCDVVGMFSPDAEAP